MIFPLGPSPAHGLVLGVVIGFGFGFVLERAGLGRAQKLAAQFYGHDMTVLKVMFSAILTALLGVVVAASLGLTDFEALADGAVSGTFLVPMIAGGFLLGVGFVVAGYCPGTSFVALASGKIDGLLTVLGVVAGQLAWAELEWRPGFSAFHGAGDEGIRYLWEPLGLSSRAGPVVVALAVCAMAIGCFVAAARIEKALAAGPDARRAATSAGAPARWLLASLGAAAVVAVVGFAVPVAPRATARRAEPISAADLASRVFEQPWKLRVIDVRELDRCRAQRVPGAECVPAPALASLRLADDDGARDLVVVGSGDEGDVPPAALDYPGRVLSLERGWSGWEEYAVSPPPQPSPGATIAELETFRLRTAIHSALTGLPAAPPPSPTLAPAAPRRAAGGGGCGG